VSRLPPRGASPAPPTLDRVISTAHAARRLAALRRASPAARIVLANGLFDPLHVGHVRYLRAARRLGTFLLVAVNDDRSARRLRGPGRPLMPGADRARIVAALEGVDAVVLFSASTVAPLLRRLRPDIHCKGTDYTPETVPEREVVLSYGGRVRIAGDPKRHASSAIIRHIGRRLRGGRPGRRQVIGAAATARRS